MASTFIKAAEVWIPSDDGMLLEFGGGAFGAAKRFAAISRSMCFGRGEGLPGRAWEQGRPVLLRSFEGSYFRRTAAAQAAGLNCAIAIPMFPNERFGGVLVLYCSHAAAPKGALELWHHKHGVATDLKLLDGAYGSEAAAFESISGQTSLPRGAGLPGLAWERGATVFLEDLTAKDKGFVRAEAAADARLQRGLSLAIGAPLQDTYVVTILTGLDGPLAKRVERWVPDQTHHRLSREFAFNEQDGRPTLLAAHLPLVRAPGDPAGSIERAWSSGIAVVSEHLDEEPGAPAVAANAIGACALVAIPVIWDGETVEVLALYV